ncbi:hypothetical protein LINPERHAP2_LOCUS16356 [Linum perenne]
MKKITIITNNNNLLLLSIQSSLPAHHKTSMGRHHS